MGGIMDTPDTTDTLMHIMDMDIGEGKGGQLKPRQQQQLIQRLIPFTVTEDTMEEDSVEDIADLVYALEEKEDQQRLKQKPLLTPRLILTCCTEDIMDMDMDLDTMDILMVDTTGGNKQPIQQNIKEMPKYIVKSSA